MDSRPLERNVIVVKWGTKYSAEHVNRLYRMAKKNISLPFTFYCYTEDSSNIDPNIVIIPLDLTLNLEAWWWKLTLFKQNTLDGINLFFDLDIVIQNNIDNLFDKVVHNKLTLIDRSVFDELVPYVYNSSIMIWYNNEVSHLYNTFIEKSPMYTSLYLGIDRFFTHEIPTNVFNDVGIDVYYFRGEVVDLFVYNENQQYSVMTPDGSSSRRVFYDKEKQICVFNSCHEDYFYNNMQNYFL